MEKTKKQEVRNRKEVAIGMTSLKRKSSKKMKKDDKEVKTRKTK